MHKRITILGVLALCGGCAQVGHDAGLSTGPRKDVIDSDWTMMERGEHEIECGPPPKGYIKIVADPVPGWRPAHMQGSASGRSISWAPLGPRPITDEYWSGDDDAGGRVVSIATHPTNPLVAYAASASGGLWKTTNAGASWTPLTDELSILNHGAVALDPSNPDIVYLGTGEYTTSSGGDGLFRSLDGGVSWTRIATAAQVGSNLSKIVVSPTDPQVIHITGTGGYVRTQNGGASWSTRLSGDCSDIVINPGNHQVLFVGRQGDGVYRSTNGGDNLMRLASGLPSASSTDRVVLAISQSSPGTVYAAITDFFGGLQGLYKTTTSGDAWSNLPNTPDFPYPQAWYDCCLAVDPTNANIVYAGGVFPTYAEAGVIRTTNGGSSWTDITITANGQLHPDMHAIAFGADGAVWVGNDGGVWRSTSPGSHWINCNANLVASQHYAIALHPTDPGRVIGGTQDNGTVQRGGGDPWPQILSGDGGFSAYDFTNPNRRYVTYVYLSIYRLFNGSAQISGPWSNDPRNFIAPLVMDPNNAKTLLGGTNRVWRTTNADTTASWTAISPTTVSGGGTLNAIAVAKGASGTIYTGSSTGRVYVTTNASTWNNRSTGLPTSDISDIIIAPTDPGTAYVAYHASSGGRIFKTTNYGVNWTNLTGTLPAGVGAKALEIDWRFGTPGIFVGSGAGIWWSYDDGATWTKDGADLPNVNIGDLQIDVAQNTITAGTYGRGVWRATLPATPPTCYANCDASTTPPTLNVSDFGCFLSKFAAGDPYANCDQSTTPPVLNIADFGCFLSKFAAGCP